MFNVLDTYTTPILLKVYWMEKKSYIHITVVIFDIEVSDFGWERSHYASFSLSGGVPTFNHRPSGSFSFPVFDILYVLMISNIVHPCQIA